MVFHTHCFVNINSSWWRITIFTLTSYISIYTGWVWVMAFESLQAISKWNVEFSVETNSNVLWKKTYFLMLPGSSVAFSLFKCSCYVPLHQQLIGFVLPSLCQCWGGYEHDACAHGPRVIALAAVTFSHLNHVGLCGTVLQRGSASFKTRSQLFKDSHRQTCGCLFG